MIRVLQLIGVNAEWEMAQQARRMACAVGQRFSSTCKTIWRGGNWRNIPCAAAMLHRERDQYDLIHAWGESALAAAALGTKLPLVLTPPARCDAQTLRRLQRLQQANRVEVICPSEVRRRRLIEHGVWAGRCRVVRPALDCNLINAPSVASGAPESDTAEAARVELRRRLGLDEADFVLLAPGESTRSAGHVEAFWAASILHVSDAKYKLLTCGSGPLAGAVREFAQKTAPGALCDAGQQIGSAIEFQELLRAADAVVWTARGAGETLPIAMCMSAGLPIVASHSAIADEILQDGQTALMCDPKPRDIARRILDLGANPAQARSVAENARCRARELFSCEAFSQGIATTYERAIELAKKWTG